MTKALLLVAFTLLCLAPAFGQSAAHTNKFGAEAERANSPGALQKAATQSAEQEDHYSAMKYYGRFLSADTTNMALQSFAEEALAFGALTTAEVAFQTLADRQKAAAAPNAETLLALAGVKYHRADYAGARTIYQSILTMPGQSQDIVDRAQTGAENSDWAIETLADADGGLDLNNVGAPVNSQYSDFSPVLRGDSLYFSSWNFPYKNDTRYPKRNLLHVLVKSPAGDTTAAPSEIDFGGKDQLTGNLCFNRAGNIQMYTVGEYVKTAAVKSEIWWRKRDASGNWGSGERLGEPINLTGYNSTDPNIGWEKGSKQEVLFFSSDRPNGKGKRDIWYALLLDDGTFSQPVNVGNVNTVEDEITPFYHPETETLYFSSRGYQTLGGFDIFKSKGKGVNWSAPEHTGFPLNSNFHDVNFWLSADGKTSYLASNRNGSQYIDDEVCCLDIYRGDWFKPEALAITFNKETGDTLVGTTVRLLELSGGNEELKWSLPTLASQPIPLRVKKKYMLVATKEGFSSDTLRFNSPDQLWKERLVKKLYLKPARVNLIARVWETGTTIKINAANSRFQDLGMVLPGGSLATGRGGAPLFQNLTSNPTDNDYRYSLEFNHRYRVYIFKNGYTVDSVDVTTEGMTGSGTIEKNLYLNRGLRLEARVYHKITNEPLADTQIRFFEVGGKRRETGAHLDTLPYTYGLDRERTYRIVISKKEFTTDSVEFSTKDLPQVAFKTIYQKLYLRPSPAKLVSFLPVSLYFDNDEPDKRTNAETTRKTYEETYNAYIGRRDVFVSSYLKGLTDQSKAASAQDKLEAFFDRDVKSGWEILQDFAKKLKEQLQFGVRIKVTFSGFASPRAKTEYNKHLTSRRVSSVRNYFMQYDKGVLAKYFRNEQLVVEEVFLGEQKAPKTVSDKIGERLEEKRESVFSVEASRERRVEIIGVLINK